MGVDELRLAYVLTASNRVMAVCLAVAASLALFALLTAGGSTVRAQTDGTSDAGCEVGRLWCGRRRSLRTGLRVR